MASTPGRETRIYCSGLWHVSGNAKRSAGHYDQLFPKTLEKIKGSQLIFYSNTPEMLEQTDKICRQYGIALQAETKPIEALPAWGLAEQIVTCCKNMALDQFSAPEPFLGEKGVAHFWRDLTQSGEAVYRQVLAIWLSKIALVADQTPALDDQDIVAWIDASLSRFQGRRSNWDWTAIQTPPGKLSHYKSPMHFFGTQLPLNASFLCAPGPVWRDIRDEFDTSAARAATMAYAHDEETILADCIRRRPELFHCIGAPYPAQPRSKFQRFLYNLRYR